MKWRGEDERKDQHSSVFVCVVGFMKIGEFVKNQPNKGEMDPLISHLLTRVFFSSFVPAKRQTASHFLVTIVLNCYYKN